VSPVPDVYDHRKKLDWSRKQLEALDREIQAFFKEHPFTLRVEVEREAKRIRILSNGDLVIPEHWSLMIGDIVHAARGALDHLTWSLATLGPVQPNIQEAKRIQFPITTNRAEYFATPNGQRIRRLSFVTSKAQAAFDTLQPHVRGDEADNDPLTILNGLSNEDKHRNILIVGGVGNVPRISLGGFGGPVSELANITNRARRLQKDAELTVLDFYNAIPEGQVEVDPDLIGDITFSEQGPARGASVVYSLKSIHKHIEDKVFPALEPFLS
jgi:hypothetical protein